MRTLHIHKPDWHTLTLHIGNLIHDPRLWGAVALVILLGLMILMAILTGSSGSAPHRSTLPLYYPYGLPY